MDIQETIDYCINSAIKIGIETYNRTLDFSDDSIIFVDEILDGYHDRYINSEKDNGLIKKHANTYAHIFGIYIGEVLRCNHASDYIWMDTEFGLTLSKNVQNQVNPIAKVYKQIINGKESGDDIKSFFNIAILIMQGKFPTTR
ncbi:hypothetical protein SAMN02745136_04730 [Anaerocolumna jejuensis DSM 15929]|uniref:Uncharacterized protein n=1 Tax=Anaerocolumna jejuensis DSM 15929 TaxID=1121322 RepID=A0A1M7A3S9_9FIRM|nr:hypothetical protein [Anaerocolumna jejuensis]SHL37193.1 hypothetical protein SAMN02745136_04730 [Anaerocolumna jejuensis DSM 15929]